MKLYSLALKLWYTEKKTIIIMNYNNNIILSYNRNLVCLYII